MTKIIAYNPISLLMDPVNWHGYALEFIIKYADYIYVHNPLRAHTIRKRLKELKPAGKARVICSLVTVNRKNNIIVGFGVGGRPPVGLKLFRGIKIFHLTDYYIDVPEKHNFLKVAKVDYVIGHCQMDLESVFFKEYYPEYIGKVINLPFGYADRFKNIVPFEDRIKKAVGLGSINRMRDALLTKEQTKEMVSFFPNREFQHEVRKFLQDHQKEFEDCVDAIFPSPEKQKDFSYDAVEMLNRYQMFVNDAGFSNFPPARTYEGIACGCVMVAPISSIYSTLGFRNNINYIGYKENNYTDMIEKIRYYIIHQDELLKIQAKSLVLAEKFTHKNVAEMLYQSIRAIADKTSNR